MSGLLFNRVKTLGLALAVLCLEAFTTPAQALVLPSFDGKGIIEGTDYPAVWSMNDSATLSKQGGGAKTTYTLEINQNCKLATSKGNCGSGLAIVDLNATSAASSFARIGDTSPSANENFQMVLTFDSKGILTSGTINVYGTLAAGTFLDKSWAAQPYGLLMSATLSNPVIDSTTKALGFKETLTGGFLVDMISGGVGTNEAFWLYTTCSDNTKACGDSAANNSNPTSWTYKTTNAAWNTFLTQLSQAGTASFSGFSTGSFYGMGGVAVLPIPGSGLLLGGALGVLGFLRHRRRKTAA